MKTFSRKPRVLVVIAHFDEMRQYQGRPNFFPQGVGHAFLAGAFHRDRVDIRLHSEVHGGPLQDLELLAWPDMVVLTGVTAALDRMRHITAHVRALAPHAVVVAGGPVVRNLPTLTAEFFDFACEGDIEELRRIAGDVLGTDCVAPEMLPRFDLLGWKSPVNYVEASRNCNFRCSFCALTGENRKFSAYSTDYVEHQIRVQPKGRYVLFIDNNFYGCARSVYRARLEMLERLWRQGLFKGWIALVTNDFFAREQNVRDAKQAGCVGLFSGVESLDPEQLAKYGKRQNLAVPQLAAMEMCLSAGLVYHFGLMFDPASQRLSDMQAQLDFIINHDRVPMPAFMSLTIPLLGTPEFHRCLSERALLPNVRLRDMDGVTMVTRPRDPVPKVIDFVHRINDLSWARRRIAARSVRFLRRYWDSLSGPQMLNLMLQGLRLGLPGFGRNNISLLPGRIRTEPRTYWSPTQPLGQLYEPLIDLPRHLRGYFEPTLVTDSAGGLHPSLTADLGRRTCDAPRKVPAL